MTARSTGRFSGRHMAAVLIVFFGVVVAVNLLMARFAIATFGGTVVTNSYVASQHFNAWLAEGRRQAALGWRVSAARGLDGRLLLTAADRNGAPIMGMKVVAAARHPLGGAAPVTMVLHSMKGAYRSDAMLPPGRWIVKFDLSGRAGRYQIESELK